MAVQAISDGAGIASCSCEFILNLLDGLCLFLVCIRGHDVELVPLALGI